MTESVVGRFRQTGRQSSETPHKDERVPTLPSVILDLEPRIGPEPSINAVSISGSGMDPRPEAWDDGECGGRFSPNGPPK